MNEQLRPAIFKQMRDLKALERMRAFFNQDDALAAVELFWCLSAQNRAIKNEVDSQIVGFFAGLPLRNSEYGTVPDH